MLTNFDSPEKLADVKSGEVAVNVDENICPENF